MTDRRTFLATSAAAGWLPALAARAAADPARTGSCILLWMNGGPSQTDTFDPKPGHPNGGPFRAIPTSVPGVRVGEHLPRVAGRMKHLAVVRSMATTEGDHGRAAAHLRTGYTRQGPIDFPVLGAVVAHDRHRPDVDLPGYVSVGPRNLGPAALTAGFLGPRFAPLAVDADGPGDDLRVEDLGRPAGVSEERAAARLRLLRESEADFLAARPGAATAGHTSAYDRAVRLMRPAAAAAFDLSAEPATLRDTYGRNRFGQGCLLARRLVERGVPFVEVVLDGWDTHDDNFALVERLCDVLDPAWSALLDDLSDRGLLASTTVVWMGEFGRTPGINPRSGRDHYPAAWSVVLGGGGVRGGQVVGGTSPDGTAVTDRPVAVPDLLATVCRAIGVDPMKANESNVNRPIRVADPAAKPVTEVLA